MVNSMTVRDSFKVSKAINKKKESTRGEEGKRLSCDLHTRVYTYTCKHMSKHIDTREQETERGRKSRMQEVGIFIHLGRKLALVKPL